MLRRTAPALCLAVAGCSLVGPPNTGPHGLSSYDGELRRLTASGRFEKALVVAEEEAGDAGDEVLAALNLAVVEHYAGDYESSNAHLQAADLEIEERFTKSVSRAALSLVTSDRALAWLPSASERLMIHVYGALNYLELGEPDEAAVEARRLAILLDELVEDEGVDALGAESRRLYRSLRYFSGAVFEQAGAWNDADVAYRLAGMPDGRPADSRSADAAAAPAVPAAISASVPERPPGPTGSVVILVESGFVAHRVEQAVHLLLGADELDHLRYGSDERRLRHARCFSRRRFESAWSSWGAGDPDGCEEIRRPVRRDRAGRKGGKNDVVYLMRVAWPTMARPVTSAPLGAVRAFSGSAPPPVLTTARDATLVTDADATAGFAAETPFGPSHDLGRSVVSADLSGSVVHEFNREAPEILVKSVVRAAVKYAVVEAVEDGAREEDETLGDIAAVVGNVFTALTERADTRSWTMLPSGLHVVRLDLPPGEHEIRIAGDGRFSRILELGTVDVRPGTVAVLSARAWPGDVPGSSARRLTDR